MLHIKLMKPGSWPEDPAVLPAGGGEEPLKDCGLSQSPQCVQKGAQRGGFRAIGCGHRQIHHIRKNLVEFREAGHASGGEDRVFCKADFRKRGPAVIDFGADSLQKGPRKILLLVMEPDIAEGAFGSAVPVRTALSRKRGQTKDTAGTCGGGENCLIDGLCGNKAPPGAVELPAEPVVHGAASGVGSLEKPLAGKGGRDCVHPLICVCLRSVREGGDIACGAGIDPCFSRTTDSETETGALLISARGDDGKSGSKTRAPGKGGSDESRDGARFFQGAELVIRQTEQAK